MKCVRCNFYKDGECTAIETEIDDIECLLRFILWEQIAQGGILQELLSKYDDEDDSGYDGWLRGPQ